LYRLFKNQKVVIHVLAFLFLPGVVVHELAHLLIANMLLVPTGEVEFFPEIQGDNVKMGSVEIASTDPLRRFVIGAAPLFVGLAVLSVLFWYFGFSFSWSWQTALLFYAVFQISNTMFSSKKDMEGAVGLMTVVLLLGLLGFLGGIRVPGDILIFFTSPSVQAVVQQLIAYVLLAIVMDAVIVGACLIPVRKWFQKRH
jgi:hypothetical protein